MDLSKSIAVLLATTAVAAPAGAQTFTGPRIEASTDLSRIRFDLTTAGTNARVMPVASIVAGYDMALSSRLVGGSEVAVATVGAPGATDRVGIAEPVDGRQDTTVTGRLGVRFGRALIYGKTGYANLRADERFTTPVYQASSTNDLDGVVFGLGTEIALASRTYVRSEWRYVAYEGGFEQNRLLTGIGFRF